MTAEAGSFFRIGPGDASPALTAELAGAKAAELWRMARLGLRVPPAFVLPTTLCAEVNRNPADAAARLRPILAEGIEWLEQATGRRFGGSRQPLLVSVRSGAARSMPGMLSTILDVGLNQGSVRGLIGLTGDPRLAWDSYRRLLETYATTVRGAPEGEFRRALEEMIAAESVAGEADLDGEALERLARRYQDLVARLTGEPVPDDPLDQLGEAATAVFSSWEGHKAREYRRLNGLGELIGTAVTVQAMVFGNAGHRSGAGVAFSRDPATGARALYVDFLFDAQGEDVVSGRQTPVDGARLAARLPGAAEELAQGTALLEATGRDVQDVEFTIEEGQLYFLQTRPAKRTPLAALHIAVEMVREGLIDTGTALARLDGIDLTAAAVTRFAGPAPPLARATPASPGMACGRAAFDSDQAVALAAAGDPVILVRREPSTEDIEGFAAASGILTVVGGRTAHAAVVARQMAKVCLVGCGRLVLEEGGRSAVLAGQRVAGGDWLWLDGESGGVGLGRRAIVTERPEAEMQEMARWRGGQADHAAPA